MRVTVAADNHQDGHNAGSSDSRWPSADRALIGAALVVAVYCLLQILQLRYGRDQGIYAVVADTVVRGGMPYRDVWDFKPPGIYVVYTLARLLFGQNEWGIRVLEAVGVASLIPTFGVLARRFFGDVRPGFLGASLAVLLHAQMEFWHSGQPESFGGVLTVLALLVGTHEGATSFESWRRSLPWWLGSGLLIGAAGLMKPHLMGAALVVGLFCAWKLRGRGLPLRVQGGSIALVFAGAFVTWSMCLAWFGVRGALGDLYQTLFVFAPGYAATTWRSDLWVRFLYMAFKGWAMGLSALMALGLILWLALPVISTRERQGGALILGVVGLHLVGIALQAKFFAYHFGATIPLGCFLAGLGLFKVWRSASKRGAIFTVAYVIGIALAIEARAPVRDLAEDFWERSWRRTSNLLSGDRPARERLCGELYSVADVNYAANMAVARYLAEHTEPRDTVYIWGFEPFIYDAARRSPATRYIYNVPQRASWGRDTARARLMEDLAAKPPRAVVVERGDVFPVVTGNAQDSATSLQEFWALRRWLEDRYELAFSVQDFEVYLERPQASVSP